MTKTEAIEAMKNGQKVTHTNFCGSEWMTMRGSKIEFEDGAACSEREFWYFRKDESWETGYSLFKG